MLNPERIPFCLGPEVKVAVVPMYFNATVPVDVEIIRTDLETNQQEVLKLSRSQIREIERKAKSYSQESLQTVVQFDYPAKKPGVYRLGKVLDEYKLQVQKTTPSTFVVPCPRAWVRPIANPNRCTGDLSDMTFEVEGTPPLKIVYSRTIDDKDRSFHVQSLQPDKFSSPLTGPSRGGSLIVREDDDISWARSQRVPVALNESMNEGGRWHYSIDEVHDALGNVVKFKSPFDDPEVKPKPKELVQNFVVKERPHIKLVNCDLRNPLKVARGDFTQLPVQFKLPGPMPDDTSHEITWQYSPIDTLTKSGDHGDVVSVGSYNARNSRDQPKISAPGLYTLKTVSAGSCEGEVEEPASCLLLNPLEPKLTLRSEEIPDTCAGNTIGLRVDLDLIGTPPFVVRCDVYANGAKMKSTKFDVSGLRYQTELMPTVAGHQKYVFTYIDDAIYKNQKLAGPEYVLEQDVKPAAGAYIQYGKTKSSACLGDEATVDVVFRGDPPFTLEWEVVFDGKRKRHSVSDIHTEDYQIKTAPLTQGGEYTIALMSVQDRRGCKTALQVEQKISVRRQSPRAAFGQIDHKRRVMAVEGRGQKLPIRLTGEGPWKLTYINENDSSPDTPAKRHVRMIRNDNDFLEVTSRGLFKIVDVSDSQCHGVVDPKTSTFQVDWYPRPDLAIALGHGVQEKDGVYSLDPVCEGDVSGFELNLKGKLTSAEPCPLFILIYEQEHRHSTLTMRFATTRSRRARDLLPQNGKHTTRRLGRCLSRGTRQSRGLTRTSSSRSRIISTITIRTSSRLSFARKSAASRRLPFRNPVRPSSSASVTMESPRECPSR